MIKEIAFSPIISVIVRLNLIISLKTLLFIWWSISGRKGMKK